MAIRNLSPHTQASYIGQVERFDRDFRPLHGMIPGEPPDCGRVTDRIRIAGTAVNGARTNRHLLPTFRGAALQVRTPIEATLAG